MIHLKLMNQSARFRSPRLLHGNVPTELRDGPICYFKTQRGPFIRSSNMFYWQCETYVSRSHKSTFDLTLRASGYFLPEASTLNKQETQSSRSQAPEGRTVKGCFRGGMVGLVPVTLL